MEKALQKAIEANNLPAIREALVNIIINDSGKIVPIETVAEVLETTPGIFDTDNGKQYAPTAAQMTDTQIRELIHDLKSNFSPEKFGLLTEVFAIKSNEGVTFITVEETRVIEPVIDSEPAEMKNNDEEDYGENTESTGKSGKKIGAVIMAIGCAAAIVGLCVPVKFLLGLGIGVFMLGTAFVYMSITRN